MTSTHDPFTGPGPHVAPDGAASGETGPDGLDALPGWLRRAVLSWGVRREIGARTAEAETRSGLGA